MDTLDKLFAEVTKISTNQAVMTSEMARMKADVEKLFDFIDTRFVTKEEFEPFKQRLEDTITAQEFEPIKKLVYGAVSIILTAVIGALIYLVLK